MEGVFQELGGDANTPILFTTLIEHPIVQDIILACNIYKAAVRLYLRYDDAQTYMYM